MAVGLPSLDVSASRCHGFQFQGTIWMEGVCIGRASGFWNGCFLSRSCRRPFEKKQLASSQRGRINKALTLQVFPSNSQRAGNVASLMLCLISAKRKRLDNSKGRCLRRGGCKPRRPDESDLQFRHFSTELSRRLRCPSMKWCSAGMGESPIVIINELLIQARRLW